MPTLFISYSSEDKNFAEQLATNLKNLGIGIWLDKWEIKVGDSIIEKIEKGIRDNDFLGIVLSPSSVESKWVRKELSAALIKELKSKSVVILPILLRDCDIPPLISDKRYADFRHDYQTGLHELLEVLSSERVDRKSVLGRQKGPQNEEIERCWKIFNDPFLQDYARDAALERLTLLKAFKYLTKIVNDILTPVIIRERALDAVVKNARGNEDFLFSIVNDIYAPDKFRRMALEGLIKAKAHNHLLKLLQDIWAPEWIRKRAAEALK